MTQIDRHARLTALLYVLVAIVGPIRLMYIPGRLFGLWLLPLGRLVVRSRYLPRPIGWLLYVNGAAYMLLSFSGLLYPALAKSLSGALFPALFGEVVFMLWLLVRGVGAGGPLRAAPAGP